MISSKTGRKNVYLHFTKTTKEMEIPLGYPINNWLLTLCNILGNPIYCIMSYCIRYVALKDILEEQRNVNLLNIFRLNTASK